MKPTKHLNGPGPAGTQSSQQLASRSPAPLTRRDAPYAEDRLEQEAVAAGERFVRGETGIARALGRTRPAAFHLRGSAGTPIPSYLRQPLEHTFGADLTSVRLHRDPEAGAAARNLGALAFAAGSSIYFSNRAPELSTKDGRRLLAHEVAHTIQQAGRSAAGNRIAVADTHGTNRPQFVKSPLESTLAANRPSFDDLADLYLDKFGHQRKTVAVIKDIRKQRTKAVAANDEAGFWTSLEGIVKDDKKYDNEELAARSFVFDALKLAGKVAGAAYLLTQDQGLFSTFFLAEVYEQLPVGDYSWLAKNWRENFFKDLTDPKRPGDLGPTRFLESFYQFLAGSTRDIPDLSVNGGFDDLATQELKKIETPSEFGGNEVRMITVWTVREVDRIRRRKLGELSTKIASQYPFRKGGSGAQWLPPVARKAIANALVAWAQTLDSDAPELGNAAEEVRGLYRELADPIRNVAAAMVTFWELVETARFNINTGKASGALLQDLTRPEFEGFHSALARSARKLFALKAKSGPSDVSEQTIFPSPAEYEKARDEFVKTLRNEYYKHFETRLFAEFRKPAPPEGKKPTTKQLNLLLAVAYGYMATIVYDLLMALDDYKRAEDDAYVANRVTEGRADIRIRNRDKVAQQLGMVGSALGWEDLAYLASQVVNALQPGQKMSQLALLGNWHDDHAQIPTLTKDFGAGQMIGNWAPFTFGDLVKFYQTARMKDITTRISGLMSGPNAFDPALDPLVSRAIHASDEAGKTANAYPRRFSVDSGGYVLQVRPEDEGTKTLSRLIFDHPKTDDLLKKEQPADGEPIAPDQRGQGVFLWIIPSFLPLIKILRGFDEFHVLVYKRIFGKDSFTAEDLAVVKDMDDMSWFESLKDAVMDNSADAALLQKGRKSFGDKLSVEAGTAQTALHAKMREASILEREMRVLKELTPALNEYDRFGQFSPSKTMGGVIYELPGKVLTRIGQISSWMAPVEDQNPHYAAMFLELAELAESRLSKAPRTDVANEYYAAIAVVQDIVKEHRAEVLMLLPGRNDAWITSNLELLNSLQKELEKKLVSGQRAFGLTGQAEGSQEFVSAVSEGDIIKADKTGKSEAAAFKIDGVDWKILSVHRNFQFHPKYGANLPAVLIIDGKELSRQEWKSSVLLLTVVRNTTKFEIRADARGEDLLNELTHAVTMALLIRQLQQLADIIEAVGELTLEAVELIPGAGQAVMAARMAISILTFIASGEAELLIDELTKNPIGEVIRIVDLMKNLFSSPSELLLFLFFANNNFSQLHSKPRKKSPAGKNAPKGLIPRFVKLVGRIWNIGEGVLGSVGRLQSHVRSEVETMQMFVLRHPLLAGALRWVSDHLEQIAGTTLMAIAVGERLANKPGKDQTAPDETEGELQQKFSEAVDALPGSMNSIAMQFAELRLPKKVLPLGEVVDVLVQIVLSKLGAKFRIAGKALLKLLDIAGKRDAVFNAIAELIPEKADPNYYWQKLVVDSVTPWMNDAKDALIDEFYDRLLAFSFFGEKKAQLDAGRSKAKTAVSTEQGELPEVEVQPHGWSGAARRGGVMPQIGPPLDPAIRSSAEGRFGHDFGHVRLATGSSGGSFASSFGADAVTSGSMIYMRPGLSPSAGAGAQILDHELTHVLQQTGPRPLGSSQGNRPVTGKTGSGLLFDPVKERAADRVATVVSNRRAAAPVHVATGRKGWQPALPYNVIRGLLDGITSTGDIERDEAKIDLTGSSTGLKKLPAKQKDRLQGFAESLKKSIQAANNFEAPFHEVKEDIKRQILESGPSGQTNFQAIENALADLAADSLRERKAKEGEVPDDQPQVVAFVDAKRFGMELGRYIFGRTGILMELDLLPADKKDESTAITVSKVKVFYVHLPPIHGKHSLWTKAIAGLIPKGQEQTDLWQDKSRLYRRLSLYLESKGPAPGIWKPRTYGLQQRVLAELVEFVKAMPAANADLEPGELPSRDQYLSPKGTSQPNIGLRLGTYKGTPEQRGKNRESHHTTQFLLLEYFAHRNDSQTSAKKRPFPLIAEKPNVYPGLNASSSGPTAFAGTTKIEIASLAKGRGDAMPAILLATPTHRYGKLHISAKADDFDQTTDSPSEVVHQVFQEQLSQDYREAEERGVQAFENYAGRMDVKVKDQIYNAMQGTYHWMRDFMQERLEEALPSIELKYYNQLAEAAGRKDRLKPSDMTIVAARSKVNNETEMVKAGWV